MIMTSQTWSFELQEEDFVGSAAHRKLTSRELLWRSQKLGPVAGRLWYAALLSTLPSAHIEIGRFRTKRVTQKNGEMA
jgi:hypothetical protein